MTQRTSKIALIQDATVIFDTQKTLDKAEKLVAEAVSNGAELILFPEAFIGGYIAGLGLNLGASPHERTTEERDEYFNSAITSDGPESSRLGEIAKKHNITLVVGVIERDNGTLYCAVFIYGQDGSFLAKHRKLVPTCNERVAWGRGDGSTMPVLDTKVGKVGVAICWENMMPLYRVYLYGKGRCFVLSTCQFLTASDFPEWHETRKNNPADKIVMCGGACAINPLGKVLVHPDYTKKVIHYVDINLDHIAHGKMDVDAVGHYSRPDIFQLHVNQKKMANLHLSDE